MQLLAATVTASDRALSVRVIDSGGKRASDGDDTTD
jgi:hypothetical protein